jgi:hypothetical protein
LISLPGTTAPVRQFPAPDSCQASNFTFRHGEELIYKIYYHWNFIWLPAGEVTFRMKEEGSQYHYQATGKTYASYDWFFQVEDTYDSWVNKPTLLPNYSERSIREGNYRIFERIAFNQQEQSMSVWRATRKGEPEKQTIHQVSGCVHDILSCLYFLRNTDLISPAAPHEIPFRIFMDQGEYPLRMRFTGVERNKAVHGMGRYHTLRFEPTVIVGTVFKADSGMKVWVSEDENRIPLLVETPVSVGSVKMVLKSYRGLRYPFKAKVSGS